MLFIRALKSISTKIGAAMLLTIGVQSPQVSANTVQVTQEIIELKTWPTANLRLHINRPATMTSDIPIVLVIPGAKRNADEYSQYWLPLARRMPLITITIECDLKQCPSEYHYNLGGYKLQDGSTPDARHQFFSVPELAFAAIKQQYQLNAKGFYLFGHSAGGTFAHLYQLMRPQAPVIHVIAANPAFFMLPDPAIVYPFGLQNSGLTESQVGDWLAKTTLVMLGDNDLAPRTKALSNSPFAQQQGLAVFSRGLQFFARSTDWVLAQKRQPGWRLMLVHGVGHDAEAMAPYALEHWFFTPEIQKPQNKKEKG